MNVLKKENMVEQVLCGFYFKEGMKKKTNERSAMKWRINMLTIIH